MITNLILNHFDIFLLIVAYFIGWVLVIDNYDAKRPRDPLKKYTFIVIVSFLTWPIIVIYRILISFKIVSK